MDRSDFLKTLGFVGAAIMTAPSFLATNEKEVGKYEMLKIRYLKEFRTEQEKAWLYGHLN